MVNLGKPSNRFSTCSQSSVNLRSYMVHDTQMTHMGFTVNYERNMTLRRLAAKITPKNAHLITLSDEKSGTMLFKALKTVL